MTLAFLALSLAVLAPDAGSPQNRDVRVMSYNIRYATASDGENIWDKRKDFLAETIRAFDPDLLGTQETLARQRDDLAARLDGYDVLAAGRDDGRRAGSKSWDSSLPRMVSWVKLRDRTDPEGRPIAFFNTHFDHRGPKARIESARLLRRKIEEKELPWVATTRSSCSRSPFREIPL